MVRDSSSSYKIAYVIVIKTLLNPEGHQNRMTGSKVKGHFTEGVDSAYWWSCIGKGLRLQPAQQACFIVASIFGTLYVLISLHDANLPEQLTIGVGFVREQVVIMIFHRA